MLPKLFVAVGRLVRRAGASVAQPAEVLQVALKGEAPPQNPVVGRLAAVARDGFQLSSAIDLHGDVDLLGSAARKRDAELVSQAICHIVSKNPGKHWEASLPRRYKGCLCRTPMVRVAGDAASIHDEQEFCSKLLGEGSHVPGQYRKGLLVQRPIRIRE
jgi:hypothetical protein